MSTVEMMAAPLMQDDLDFELDEESKELLTAFDDTWKQFLEENPELVPDGKREQTIKKLQERVQAMAKSQKEVSEELQKQLDFFEKSRVSTEQGFAKDMENTKSKQKKIEARSAERLEGVVTSEQLLSETKVWEYFLKATDELAENRYRGSKGGFFGSGKEGTSPDNGKRAKPSDRAMSLVDDNSGEIRDIQLRAYEVEHALLNVQIKMLQKEAEAYEKYLDSQKTVGKFLNDHDIFTIVTNKPQAQAVDSS